MRISPQSMEKPIAVSSFKAVDTKVEKSEPAKEAKPVSINENSQKQESKAEASMGEKLQEAVTAINDFLEVEKKASKFVLHEGLDKYYVKLVDPETEEVIKEIPPESLLNAFYEMKKLAGMVVDEKI
ncbi:MAG: flagellar protein FlaG [Caryophanon sp.]|nr:flagellar protein FlaG [Caryophanon sp.]